MWKKYHTFHVKHIDVKKPGKPGCCLFGNNVIMAPIRLNPIF